MRQVFLSLFCQEMLSVTFFLIHALIKENCTKGRVKVQTCSETSSQDYAGKLQQKSTSLPGVQVLPDGSMP